MKELEDGELMMFGKNNLNLRKILLELMLFLTAAEKEKPTLRDLTSLHPLMLLLHFSITNQLFINL